MKIEPSESHKSTDAISFIRRVCTRIGGPTCLLLLLLFITGDRGFFYVLGTFCIGSVAVYFKHSIRQKRELAQKARD
jgi:hypothetical protein